ncbi:DUF2808 domain-containing protein [Cyanobacteria bacterium FACHB-63]|nr:DUF2808 domain-containing protein [Cyanobacteria bacterium FACHB-63]
MQRFIYSSFSALILVAATLATATQAAEPLVNSATFNRMEFSFTAPFISSSGLLNNHHVIRVMVVGMALEDLRLSIPPQMTKFNQVRVTDSSGKAIPAKIAASKEQVAIVFDQPVQPGTTLSVEIDGIRTEQEEGNILLYGVTAKRVGLAGQIPIGTARIQVPSQG